MKRRKYGIDVYIIAFIVITVNLSVIIAKFFGKDLGPTIPESLESISRQIEFIAVGYTIWRNQRQTNNAHRRVSAIKENENPIAMVIDVK